MTDIVIASAARTPIGSFAGAFAATPAHELGKVAITAALQRAKVDAGDVSEVVLGQVLTANQGMNPARQASRAAGVPDEAPAWSLNQVCGSGLRAVVVGYQQIKAGDARIVVAGGQENMSLAPHVAHLRNGQKMGSLEFNDSMIKDGLTDVFYGYHMGVTAENIAKKFNISRKDQDEFALASQQKYATAEKEGFFKGEIHAIALPARKKDAPPSVIEADEHPRRDTTIDSLSKLKPLFEGGVVTAGNASGVNDGAAALVIASRSWGEKKDKQPMARILSAASAAVEPRIMGVGPAYAIPRALERAGLALKDMDLIEINEAFASQVLGCLKLMNVDFKDPRVNPNGGAIAIGHPLGCSGARLALTVARELQQSGGRYAAVSLCIGVGQGLAIILERAN